jgi:hypothetical protein
MRSTAGISLPALKMGMMACFVSIMRDWIAGVCCAAAAVLSGYMLFFVEGRAGAGIWLHVVFLMAILLGTVMLVRLLARGAIASMDRGVGRRED